MDDWKVTRNHSILAVDRRGDTLIVTPEGDLHSFSSNEFHGELERIRRIAKKPPFKHIICDFSLSPYFSQEMVVPLFDLRESIRGRGQIVMCGLSEDMQTSMSHSSSGTHVLQFPDRASAVKTVASETFFEKLKKRTWLTSTILSLFVLVITIGIWSQYRGGLFIEPEIAAYRTLQWVWSDYQSIHSTSAVEADWEELSNRAAGRLQPKIDALLKMSPERKNDATTKCLTAIKSLLRLTKRAPPRPKEDTNRFLAQARDARIAILLNFDTDVDVLSAPIDSKLESLPATSSNKP